jgi:trk system potassium uptake protein TrkH
LIPALTREDLKIIGFNLCRFGNVVGVLLLVPIIVAVIYKEFDMIPHFLIASSITFILCNLGIHFLHTKKEMELKHALCFAALTWIFSMLLAAIPFWLSGATGSYLDANFDAMSGFTTTGLTLVRGVDHLSHSINFYRHYLQFVGGMGIIVVSLMILARSELSSVLAFKGEARDLGIRPNIVRTSRIILGIAITFMVIGAALFAIAGVSEGANIGNSVFDGVNYSMAAYSTGGFSPHSQSILFYHSTLYEIVALIIFLIGSFNFTFHYAVLSGKRKEIFKNIEIRTLFITLTFSTIIISGILLFSNVYSSWSILFKKAFFQAVSAHTTTGFSTISSVQLASTWPSAALFIMSIIMVLGACANSTGGGIKAIRVGIIAKSFFREIKRALSPKSAVVVEKFHHLEDTPLTETIARGAVLIAFGYIFLFALGTTVTALYGYNMSNSLFEAASAVGNVGLSSGITSPAMPVLLKLLYIFLMWAGRLEIIAVLVLIGFTILGLRKGVKKLD